MAALFAGALSATFYAVCRLFLQAPYATAAAALATLSPLNFFMLPELRDYAKAPFIVGVVLCCGWLVKSAEKPRQLLAAAAVAGIVAGVGFGFRADLAMALPFFALVLSLTAISSKFRNCRTVVVAGVAFLGAFACCALPILVAYRGGGALAHITLLGLTTPHLTARSGY